MSYKQRLSDLRSADRPAGSLTQGIVDALAAAIESGELAPEERLPPTRELAELVGVNHLTAVRAYRRLRELGLVHARVGSGTFVRDPGRRTTGRTPEPDAGDWQRFVLPPRPPSVLTDLIRATGELGGDDVQLAVAYPPTALLPAAALAEHTARAFAEHGPAALQYGPIEGTRILREAVARRTGPSENPRDVLVVNGAMQGLSLVARALVRPGDVVACESPGYPGVIEALRATGARVHGIPVDEDGLDVDALAELVSRQEVRLVALQSLAQNPSGTDLSPERAGHLVALARRYGFFLLDDEVWRDVRFVPAPGQRLRDRAPGHVVAVGGATKILGGGLRLGWIQASGPVLDRLVDEKRRDDTHTPLLTQLAVGSFMHDDAYDAHVAGAVAAYRERADALVRAARRHLAGLVSFAEPRGGASVWLRLERDVAEAEVVRAAELAGVWVMPGGAAVVEPPAQVHLRLAYGLEDPDRVEEGVARLARAIRTASAPAARRASYPIT
jgi:DNA-binding transcriptional MocR family regulator